jgi:thermitase
MALTPASWRRAGRLVAGAALLLTLTGPLAARDAQAALPSAPDAEIYPRAEQPVEVRQGDRTIRVRPLKTVRDASGREALADRLIVAFQAGVSDADRDAAHQRAGGLGAVTARPLLAVGPTAVLVDVAGAASLETAARAYQGDARVRFAGPDWLMHADETPNDPDVAKQAGLGVIRAPAAWNRTHGHSGVRIAVLDTGIDEAHADLAGKVVGRRDFTGSGSGTADVAGHGTHVAGIAAAATNNAVGVAGVGYDSRLLNVKVLDDTGSGSMSMLFNGIRWAADNGANVINMSLGADQDCDPNLAEDIFDAATNELRDAIGEAWDAGAVLVASAGNNGTSREHWPGACPNVLAVANTTSADVKAANSNFGAWVDLAAPGTSIWSTAVPGALKCQSGLSGAFAFCSGTSMAAPHVAGLAALVRASCGFPSNATVVERLTGTADAIAGTGTLWRHGRINALNAACFPAPANVRIGNVTAVSIQLLWNDTTPGETRFEVERKPLVGGATTITLPANATSFLDSGLSAGTVIDYRVRGCDGAGCSAWSSTVRGMTGGKLTVTLPISGKVTSAPAGINCGLSASDCTEVYTPGTVVTLTPTPYANSLKGIYYTFDHWEGACSGQAWTCTITVTGSKTVKAVFVRDTAGDI